MRTCIKTFCLVLFIETKILSWNILFFLWWFSCCTLKCWSFRQSTSCVWWQLLEAMAPPTQRGRSWTEQMLRCYTVSHVASSDLLSRLAFTTSLNNPCVLTQFIVNVCVCVCARIRVCVCVCVCVWVCVCVLCFLCTHTVRVSCGWCVKG